MRARFIFNVEGIRIKQRRLVKTLLIVIRFPSESILYFRLDYRRSYISFV